MFFLQLRPNKRQRKKTIWTNRQTDNWHSENKTGRNILHNERKIKICWTDRQIQADERYAKKGKIQRKTRPVLDQFKDCCKN